ncbi:hypothetical protein L6164_026062 [Bauhinia variegata]|uniref:Uncharacterized protein n=1 Tax=Bauhinia variegata TaxID=167791 RepID=A0ACB9M2W3_BAUVA|nr:hypothetical protein L6164_026062 [Bauhinia variegata]
MKSLQVNWKPNIGMEFDSGEVAWQFWVEYGGRANLGYTRSNAKNDLQEKNNVAWFIGKPVASWSIFNTNC